MNTEEMIEVLQAHEAGADIKAVYRRNRKLWFPWPKDEDLNFKGYEYRLEEEPESIEVDIWKHRDNGLTISVTSDQSIPSSPRDGWKLLKTVTIEV